MAPHWIVVLTFVSVAPAISSVPPCVSWFFSPKGCLCLHVQMFLDLCLFPLDPTWMSASVFLVTGCRKRSVYPLPRTLPWNPWNRHRCINVCNSPCFNHKHAPLSLIFRFTVCLWVHTCNTQTRWCWYSWCCIKIIRQLCDELQWHSPWWQDCVCSISFTPVQTGLFCSTCVAPPSFLELCDYFYIVSVSATPTSYFDTARM